MYDEGGRGNIYREMQEVATGYKDLVCSAHGLSPKQVMEWGGINQFENKKDDDAIRKIRT
jgi:hypothetical protein